MISATVAGGVEPTAAAPGSPPDDDGELPPLGAAGLELDADGVDGAALGAGLDVGAAAAGAEAAVRVLMLVSPDCYLTTRLNCRQLAREGASEAYGRLLQRVHPWEGGPSDRVVEQAYH